MVGDADGDESVDRSLMRMDGGFRGPTMQANNILGNVYVQNSGQQQSSSSPDPSMLILAAEGEEQRAKLLFDPLRAAGYNSPEKRTIDGSSVRECSRILELRLPVVVCATVRAMGTRWTREIVRTAVDIHAEACVFVVQLDEDADIEHLATQVTVARYADGPGAAVRQLLGALATRFPPTTDRQGGHSSDDGDLLDDLSECTTFDVDAIGRFRRELRPEVGAHYPAALSPWEFLDRAGLWRDGRLTGTGALLFAARPMMVSPTAMVKCTQYFGADLSAKRDTVTFEGTVPGQVISARQFVADRVRLGETPSADQAQAVDVYEYPMVAVREIIANALVHRDYSVRNACVHIRLFTDRLEVTSPGDWMGRVLPPGSASRLADLQGQSTKRNFHLARILTWIRLVEGEGSGLPTAVKDCEVHQSPSPTVIQDQGFVTVTLYRRPSTAGQAVHSARPAHPATLPRPVRHFVGRKGEMDQLSAAADSDGPTVSVVHGMGGVGKTALVVHWARYVADQFPDGQLYVDLRGYSQDEPMSPAEALTAFLVALGVAHKAVPTSLAAMAMLYRSLVAGRRFLVVLDNARDADQVRPLLPGDRRSAVVITSRDSLTELVVQEGAASTCLRQLPVGEADLMMARLLGEDRVSAEPQMVTRLVERCGSLPLAIVIVAAHATSTSLPLAVLDQELDEESSRLDVDFEAVFSWSYQALQPAVATLFRQLGRHPGPDIGLHAIAALAGIPSPAARALVNKLTQAHLLEEHAPGRYRLHDLVRSYAYQRYVAEGADEAATDRLVDHYLRSSAAAAVQIDPYWDHVPLPHRDGEHRIIGDHKQAVEWFVSEYATLLQLINLAATRGLDTQAWQLAWTFAPFLNQRGLWRDWLSSQETALAAADRLVDPVAQSRAHRCLGLAYGQLGQFADALVHHARALDLCQTIGDHTGQAHIHLAMSDISGRQGSYTDALTHAQHAWELSQTVGDARGEARALNVWGWWHARLGRHRQALTYLEQALGIFRELDDRDGKAEVMDHVGYVHHCLHHYDQAVMHYKLALDLWHQRGDTYNEAVTRAHLGDTHHASGDASAAVECWQQALAVLDSFNDPDAEVLLARLDDLHREGVT